MGTIAAFWTAYVLARLLGTSIADDPVKPRALSRRGIGDGPICLVLPLAHRAFVALVSVTKLEHAGHARRHATRAR
ncbi:MAG TPA: hypothetical protein VNU19_16460 [Candidatus Acidoferrum sp.]|jgi:uncharacterized membrane-anchored protein|nr:hypothetical protein [Candidatus Acidoferrum sp.]